MHRNELEWRNTKNKWEPVKAPAKSFKLSDGLFYLTLFIITMAGVTTCL